MFIVNWKWKTVEMRVWRASLFSVVIYRSDCLLSCILHYLVPHFLFHYVLLVKYKRHFTYTFLSQKDFFLTLWAVYIIITVNLVICSVHNY